MVARRFAYQVKAEVVGPSLNLAGLNDHSLVGEHDFRRAADVVDGEDARRPTGEGSAVGEDRDERIGALSFQFHPNVEVFLGADGGGPGGEGGARPPVSIASEPTAGLLADKVHLCQASGAS